MVALGSKLMPTDLVVHAELDGEAVLLNIETGVYFGLDSVGADIWRLLTTGRSGTDAETIAAALFDQYDVSSEQLRHDVGVFLAALAEHGLLRTVDG